MQHLFLSNHNDVLSFAERLRSQTNWYVKHVTEVGHVLFVQRNEGVVGHVTSNSSSIQIQLKGLPWLGGLYISMNFLKVLRQHMSIADFVNLG